MPWGSESWLLERYRRAQVALAARAALAVRSSWLNLVHPRRLEQTAPFWLAEALRTVAEHRSQAEDLAEVYLRLHRAMRVDETLPARTPPVLPQRQVTRGELRQEFAQRAEVHIGAAGDDNIPVAIDEDYTWPDLDEDGHDEAARVSLTVAGPLRLQQHVQRAERGRLDDADFLADLDALMNNGSAVVAANADREVLRGGRDLLAQASRTDRRVIGWARITGSDPCAFCAMLASRGAVYRSYETAKFKGQDRYYGPPVDVVDLEKYHPGCHCTVKEVYSRTDWIPDESAQFEELWRLATQGESGRDALNAFRRAIEARRRQRARRDLPLLARDDT